MILLVGPSLGGGGAEGRFRTLAREVFGGTADVAVLTATSSPMAEFEGRLLSFGWAGEASYPLLVWRLARRLRSKRYDVVMAFGLFPGVVTAVARLLAPPASRFIYTEITRPEAALKLMRGWRRPVYRLLWKMAARGFDVLSANSIDGLDELLRLGGKESGGVRVHNLMDAQRLKELAAAEHHLALPPRYFVWHGRLVAMKRVDTIIEAIARIASEFPDTGLVIIGDGEATKALQDSAAAWNLEQRVVFAGARANPFPILARATAYVLASEHEGFSNAVLEAMFLDLPVITSHCSSDMRAMAAQGAAIGFDVGDVGGLERAMRAVLVDPEVGRRLRSAARAYRLPHELSRSLADYEALLRRVAQEGRAR